MLSVHLHICSEGIHGFGHKSKGQLSLLTFKIGMALPGTCYLCTSTAHKLNHARGVIFLQLVCQCEENKINDCVLSHLGSLALFSTRCLSPAL